MIDNGSGDGSEAAIRTAFPNIPVIQTGSNLGYAGGSNIGLRFALTTPARYVVLLNNDTEVRDDPFGPLLEVAAAAKDSVVLGPSTYELDEDESIQFLGVDWLKDELRFKAAAKGDAQLEFGRALIRTEYVQGSAIFLPMLVLKQVGLFDERFFLTYEEIDWCFRARQSGFGCWVVPDSRIWHKSSPSFGGRQSPMYEYFTSRNELLWLEKHLGRAVAIARMGKPLYWEMSRRLRQRQFDVSPGGAWLLSRSDRAFLRGQLDYIRRRFGDCPRWIRQ